MTSKPSPEYLRSRLAYDPDTGLLRWKARPEASFQAKTEARRLGICIAWNMRYAGQIAFNTVGDGGGLTGMLDGRYYQAHQVAFAIAHGRWPTNHIRAVDGDQTNNRANNLRDTAQSEITTLNNLRREDYRGTCARGVRAKKTKTARFVAYIEVGKRERYLGSFTTLEEAVAARELAVRSIVEMIGGRP